MADLSTHASMLSRLRDLGDQDAWSWFDERYKDLILRYCRRKGLQPSDAEDVRQIVLLNLARGLGSFQYDRSRGRFRDYLGLVVRNAIHRLFRSPNARLRGLETSVEKELIAAPDTELDDLWDKEWMHAHYRRALEKVRCSADPKSVLVFELLLDGATLDAAAAELDMRRETVQKVKQRMRDRLRTCVEEQVAEEEGLEPA